MKYSIGIDIGGTNTVIGTADPKGKVLSSRSFKTAEQRGFEPYIKRLIAEISDVIGKSEGECCGIGIGAPNGNYYSGRIEFAPNLPFGESAPIVERLREAFGFQHIYLTNDANAAALGERIYGGGKIYDHFITITLGTGLGAGVIIDGKMLYGSDGNAGELGHVKVAENGRVCGCGGRGCLETYVSATGIKRTYFELLGHYNGKSSIVNMKWDEIDSRTIEDAAREGDLVCQEAYRITGRMLGRSLADFVHFTSPSAFFIFGGLAKAGELLFSHVREAMEENLMPIFRNKVKILPSELPAADAAILGSSALVWSAIENS